MYHYSQGVHTKQGHKAIPEGCFEEEQGRKGFFGPVSHLIRKKPSTRWKLIDGPLKPRMYDLVKMSEKSGEQRLFFNKDVTISLQWQETLAVGQLEARRNADGDLILFCHAGSGEILTEYGLLNYSPGQYIMIPKCVAYTVLAASRTCFLAIESLTSLYDQPDRGIVGRHVPYDVNAIAKPDLAKQQQKIQQLKSNITKIVVKHSGQKTTFEYDEDVYDVIGWKGDFFPYTLHMDDIMPLMSHRVHLPPSAHSTFVAREFVVCSFLPRPLEKDADALKVPFYHQNIDYDEILFYHDGDFFSRDNLHAGMLSFHPAGFPHGPHPKAVKNIGGKTETNEKAVMIDTRWPLQRDPVLEGVELHEYWKSWRS